MYLSSVLDSEVQEVVFLGFHVEKVISMVHEGCWSVVMKVVEEEWAHMAFFCESDLPESILHFEFCDEEDIF